MADAATAPLLTERLLLRPFHDDAGDRDAYAALCADAEVMRYIGMGETLTREQSSAQLTRFVEHWTQHGYGLRAIVERGGGDGTPGGDGTVVGFVGVMRAGQPGVRAGDVEIGWRLARDRWGRGYATEGARAVRDHAFAQLRLARLVAFVRPGNAGSMRVMDKLGMRLEKEGLCNYGRPMRIYALDNPLASATDRGAAR
ncbi:GNAT family N-acetyltransferase [Conexibacter sp. CPCC 206217]|uniref:GNAT family N-acetyltransferase n=1 Tax=Conexibacter sp. CPCC 206217 TaxID=3064574 RepID=UPI0027256F90|nr:GNAT family N-acetyltransferase [Conexibacter sp. CPCC 206217]MDO8211869.1 GNAT family N-acetyltransferase [Conexibacter sp. CPCC 206217]